MVMRSLVLYRDGLFHQSAFFELIAIDKGATVMSLLVWSQGLGKVFVDFSEWLRRVNVLWQVPHGGVLVFITSIMYVLSPVGNRRASAPFTLALASARGIQGSLLLFRFKSSNELAIDETVIHNSAW